MRESNPPLRPCKGLWTPCLYRPWGVQGELNPSVARFTVGCSTIELHTPVAGPGFEPGTDAAYETAELPLLYPASYSTIISDPLERSTNQFFVLFFSEVTRLVHVVFDDGDRTFSDVLSNHFICDLICHAPRPGFEPRITDSESVVLPVTPSRIIQSLYKPQVPHPSGVPQSQHSGQSS